MIDAATALDWGLVNRVVPADELDAEVDALADAHRARRARTCSRSASARSTRRKRIDEAEAYALACRVMVDNAQADDAHEGMRAFLEKRAPAVARTVTSRPISVRRRHGLPLARARSGTAPYARLWTGAFVSNIGTWMETIALGIYVTERDRPGRVDGHGRGRRVRADRASSARSAARSPTGSRARRAADDDDARADRRSRRCSQSCSSSAQPSAPVVTLIVFGNGIGAALGFPAFQAMLPDLVPEEDLAGRDRAVVGAVQPRPRRRPRARRRRHQPSAATRGREASTRPASSPSSPCCSPSRSRRRRRTRRRREALALDRRRLPLRARASPACASASLAMCLNTFLAAPFIALVPAMAEKVLRRGHARHVDPGHRAGHRRGARWRSRSARSSTRFGIRPCARRR